MTAIFSMLPSITDSQTWFYVAGAIGAVALAIGFLAAAASLIFGWRMNAEQKSATQVEIANVESAANERIEIETTKVKSAAEERIAKVESESREKIAGLTAEAELAKKERAEADKEIATAKADAARAKEGIANAEAVSAKAGVEVARLQVVVSNAEKMRLEAEKALLELKERIKPRSLTAKQRAEFVKTLRRLPHGTIDFGFTSGGGDEALNLARQLLALFQEAGWTVRNEASIANHLDISVTGIGILMRGSANPDPSKPPPPAAIILTPTLATLQAAFKTISMAVQFINVGPSRDETIVEVVVGSKPEP